jgi:hypothetical protein
VDYPKKHKEEHKPILKENMGHILKFGKVLGLYRNLRDARIDLKKRGFNAVPVVPWSGQQGRGQQGRGEKKLSQKERDQDYWNVEGSMMQGLGPQGHGLEGLDLHRRDVQEGLEGLGLLELGLEGRGMRGLGLQGRGFRQGLGLQGHGKNSRR